MDLLDFLRARLDEDERQAENLDELGGFERNGIESTAGGQVLDYLDHFSPTRMRAEVEAKRRRLRLIETMLENPPTAEDGPWAAEAYKGDALVGFGLLRFESLPYTEHPDYDEAWRP